jgi:hypothetical protein
MMYLGDYLDNATVYFPFTTNAADGGRESFSAALEEADIVVLKNGVAMTLSASTITISLDLGGRTGVHTVAVDMNNDADFTTGADYAAVLYASDETLDSQAPAGVLACWSCENRTAKANVTQIGGDTQSATDLKDFADAGYDPSTNKVQGVVLVDTTTTNTDMRGTDNAGTAAELAKVPKSDSNVTWNATAAAQIQSEANDALVAFGPSTAVALAAISTTIGVAGAGLTEAGGDGDHLTAINLPNQTMDIVGNITGNLSGSVGSVAGAVGSVTGAVGSVTGSVGSLATQAKADVNAEVLDVLNTDTFAEPGQGAPAATASLVAKIGYLFKAWRNRSTQTSSEYALYADDATTKDQEAVVSDNGTTYDRGEIGTGA